MNPFHHALLAALVPKFEEGDPAFSPSQTSINTIFWAQPYKSSDFPMVTTTKPYFVIYSTDHYSGTSSTDGWIYWGEFDSFDGNRLTGFIERGLIREGYQNESPFALNVPAAVSGITDEFFLFYHTMSTDPRNSGIQETHLMTCAGGELHNTTWTEQVKPLPVQTGDDHLGYLRPFEKADGTFVGHHLYDGLNYLGGAWSTSTNGINWTRGGTYTGYENMPDGLCFYRVSIFPFERNGKLLGLFRCNEGDQTGTGYLGVAELDPTTYLPSVFIKKIIQYQIHDMTVHYEGNTAYVLMKKDPALNPNTNPYYMFKYDLTDLD